MNDLFPYACYFAYLVAVCLLVWYVVRKVSNWRELNRQLEIERRLGYRITPRDCPDYLRKDVAP